jgi:hypothetical protein
VRELLRSVEAIAIHEKKPSPEKVWNRIEMLQQPIVAIACASAANRRRWVAITLKGFPLVVPPHASVLTMNLDTVSFSRNMLKIGTWI